MHWSTVVLCLFVLIGVSEQKARGRKLNYCMLNNFFLCSQESLSRFTNQHNATTGVPRSEEEYEEMCHALGDVMFHCMENFMKRCGSGISREMFNFMMGNRMTKNLDEFCKRGDGSIREKFLRHADCMDKVKATAEYRSTCVRDLQQEYENPVDATHQFSGWVKNICCSTNRWTACLQDLIKDRCGQDTADMFPYLMRALDFGVIGLCKSLPQYYPTADDTVCDKVLLRNADNPKGFKSNNLFSYYFSYACPNVGYGVE